MIVLFILLAMALFCASVITVGGAFKVKYNRPVLIAAVVAIVGSMIVNLRAGMVADSEGITGQMAGGEAGWALLGLGVLLMLVAIGRAIWATNRH